MTENDLKAGESETEEVLSFKCVCGRTRRVETWETYFRCDCWRIWSIDNGEFTHWGWTCHGTCHDKEFRGTKRACPKDNYIQQILQCKECAPKLVEEGEEEIQKLRSELSSKIESVDEIKRIIHEAMK